MYKQGQINPNYLEKLHPLSIYGNKLLYPELINLKYLFIKEF